MRGFGGSFGSFGETIQATGSSDRFGYAFSLHRATSSGQVNQSVLAGPNAAAPPADDQTIQSVGSGYFGESALAKLRYQIGGNDGYGYLQLDYRGSVVNKDESALLTNYWPPGFDGGGDDAVHLSTFGRSTTPATRPVVSKASQAPRSRRTRATTDSTRRFRSAPKNSTGLPRRYCSSAT